MRKERMDSILLWGSVLCFLIHGASYALMPAGVLWILPGILFWAGLAGGVALQAVLEFRRRKFFAGYSLNYRKMQKPRCGLLSFGSNRYAWLADGSFVISFLALVLAMLLTKGTGILCYYLLAVTDSSFCLHCVFNGRNFFHVNNKYKIRLVLENKESRFYKRGRLK